MGKFLIANLLAASCLLFSVAAPLEDTFEIIGIVTGFDDGTVIYLTDITTPESTLMDSTVIKNGKFRFAGSLKHDVVRVMIRTSRFTNYKYFWMENTSVSFTAEKGKFREAKIIGSKTNSEVERLDASIKSSGRDTEENINFIKSHPESIISANVLSIYESTWGKDTISALYKGLTEQNKSSLYGKNILDFLTLNKNPEIDSLILLNWI